jgi:hypothetical protein
MTSISRDQYFQSLSNQLLATDSPLSLSLSPNYPNPTKPAHVDEQECLLERVEKAFPNGVPVTFSLALNALVRCQCWIYGR